MKVIDWLKRIYYTSSSERYVKYLRKNGVYVGKNTIFRFPKTCYIDMTRPYLISIGDNVDFNINFKIYTHDWASKVFLHKFKQMVCSSGVVKIGNNIYFGADCKVLKGCEIGDNCVIGAGSIVSKSIPANSVAVGAPCRVICSIEDYFEKRKSLCLKEAKECVNEFIQKKGRLPRKEELKEFDIFYEGQSSSCLRFFNSYDEFLKSCMADVMIKNDSEFITLRNNKRK